MVSYQRPEQITEYINAAREVKPLHLSYIRCPYNLFDTYSFLLTPTEFKAKFFDLILGYIATDNLLLREICANPTVYDFHCFARQKPIKKDLGYEFPALWQIPEATIPNTLSYIHDVGYEMDPSVVFDEADFPNTNPFCASGEGPLPTYLLPEDPAKQLSFVLIYRHSPYQTPDTRLIAAEEWGDSKNFLFDSGKYSARDLLEFPTLRDLLVDILIIDWI